jgi:hypothetical protein
MKYVILRKGFGEGCDYTIGCNMTWEIRDFDGTQTKELIIIPIDSQEIINIDLNKAREKHNKIVNSEIDKENEDLEKKQYERLKEKYEVTE